VALGAQAPLLAADILAEFIRVMQTNNQRQKQQGRKNLCEDEFNPPRSPFCWKKGPGGVFFAEGDKDHSRQTDRLQNKYHNQRLGGCFFHALGHLSRCPGLPNMKLLTVYAA
jgi:hypothetical protein